jgi:hypothetical protein
MFNSDNGKSKKHTLSSRINTAESDKKFAIANFLERVVRRLDISKGAVAYF